MRRNFLFAFLAFTFVGVLFFGARKILAQSGEAPSLVTRAVDESQLVTLRGNVHPMARAEYDQGAVASTMPMNHMLLVLKRSPQQETALDNLIAQQADKNSPNYHKWLTPAEFGQQFGLSDQDLAAVTTWLGSHGFQVNQVSAGRDMIDFSGNAGEIQEAFHTEIHNFLTNGQTHYANASDLQIPAALAPVVAGVNGLTSFRPKPMIRHAGEFKMNLTTRRAAAVKPELTLQNAGCYNAPDTTPNTPCYVVAPYDFATIYNLLPLWNAGYNGAGENIAIVSDSDVETADYTQFRQLMGLGAETVNRVIPTGVINPGVQNCNPNTFDEQEAILDVEWAGAVAPGATIDLVIAPSSGNCTAATPESGYPFGGDYAAYYEVNLANHDPILSDSYGECELGLGMSGNTFYNNLWQQANTEGITVLTATGDSGAAGCDDATGTEPAQDGLQVDGTASTPYDTAVGGTDFTYSASTTAATYWTSTNSPSGSASTLSANGPIPETVYNDSCTNPIIEGLLDYSNVINACNSEIADEDEVIGPVGGSGGMSACTAPTGQAVTDCAGGYAKPTWQTGTGVPADGHRDIPDVSLFAGDGEYTGTFYIVCEQDYGIYMEPAVVPADCDITEGAYFFAGDGGTSASVQAFAGLVAVLDQYQTAAQGHAVSLGSVSFNANMYTLAANEGNANCNNSGSTPLANSSPCIFKDITTGTNSMPCISGDPNCGTSITSRIVPVARPWIEFRWTPLGIAMLVCTLCAATFLFLLPSGRRRWSAALALVLFAVLFGTVSCGGGGGNGTVSGGGGSSNTVGVLSGYNATTGYDEATGLGSVNATNLIKASGW